MWDDALIFSGRQTKWKCALSLILLAVLAIMAALLLERGQNLRFYGIGLKTEGTWQGFACTPDTKAIAQENRLFLLEDDRISVLDQNLKTLYTVSADRDMMLMSGEKMIAFSPMGKQVLLLDDQAQITVPVSGGVDAVAAGQHGFAVITSGSGCITRSKILDYDGTVTGQIDLKESAMLRCAFSGELLAALCYDEEGVWSLEYYTRQGEKMISVPLAAEFCYDLISVGTGIAVYSSDGLLFFNEQGSAQEEHLLGTNEILHWAADEKGYLAVVCRSRGQYRLKTLSETGELLGEAVLPMEIRDLEVSGSNVCVLDNEQLQVYDAFCRLLRTSQDGAGAASITAGGNILWLVGDGEIMCMNS